MTPWTMDMKRNLEICVKAFGIGDGGIRAISRMVKSDAKSLEWIAVDTDKQALSASSASAQILIGASLSDGQADCVVDEESRGAVAAALAGADMVVIAAGMGGSTGTCVAPVIAGIAKKMGILTVGIVTKPFSFEGSRRILRAEKGVAAMLARVDSLIVIANEQMTYIFDPPTTTTNAFEFASDAMCRTVCSLVDLTGRIKRTDDIRLDAADISTVMRDAGMVYIGVGRASGDGRAEVAANMAIFNPLLETPFRNAKRVLFHFTGSKKQAGLKDLETVANMVQQATHPDALFICGAVFDETREDKVCVTVVASV